MPAKAIQIIFFLAIAVPAVSQHCAGTLGSPVVNIDFGFGPNPGPSFSQIPSNYQYSSDDCPPEGFYTVRTSTFFCSANNWNVVPSDHTHNNPDGYFMMINTKPGISDFFVDTVRGLCPSTTFEVGAWFVNLVNAAACGLNDPAPKVIFTITDLTGTLITQYTTPSINRTQAFNWSQYRFQFPGPASGEVILKMTVDAPPCGNDLALDDITFRPCAGSISASVTNESSASIQVCENSEPSYVLNASYNGLSNPALQWQFSADGNSWTDIAGATGNSYSRQPTSVGRYYYRFFIADKNNSNCGFYSNLITIEVQSLFAQATNYVFGCYGAAIELFAAGGAHYDWTGPNGFASSDQGPVIPHVSFSNTGMYIVKISTVAGCFAYDTTNLVIYAAPIATAAPGSTALCDGDSVQLFASGSVRYKWEPSTGLSNDTIPNPVARPSESTIYTVKVFNEHTCYDTASINIIVWKRPAADAGPDKFTFKNRGVILQGNVSGSDISYSWSPPLYLNNTSLERPKAAPPASIVYTLTVTSNDGCGVASDDVKVEVIDKMFIPSAFTPNHDGLNDVWEIITFEEYPNGTVQVFNRWGQLIYFSKGFNYRPWDGTFKGQPVESGTYVYIIDLHNNKKILKGTVTVVR